MPENCDEVYTSLLSLAEFFRNAPYQNYKDSLMCLFAILHVEPPIEVEARTCFKIGQMYYYYSQQYGFAKKYFEKCWNLSRSLSSKANMDMKCEVVAFLAKIYQREKAPLHITTQVLKQTILQTHIKPYWAARLSLQLSQIFSKEKDFEQVVSVLKKGKEICVINGSPFIGLLLHLSQGLILLSDAMLFPESFSAFIEESEGLLKKVKNLSQLKVVNVFHSFILVCSYLVVGKSKSVKAELKSLQAQLQNLNGIDESQSSTSFMWLSKEFMTLLAYMLIVLHAIQVGYVERAVKYVDKALAQIHKFKQIENKMVLLSTLEQTFREYSAILSIITGKCAAFRQQVEQSESICRHQPHLSRLYTPRINTLRGLYHLRCGEFDECKSYFKAVLNNANCSKVLHIFVALQLACVYMKTHPTSNQLSSLMKSIEGDKPIIVRHYHLHSLSFLVESFSHLLNGDMSQAKSLVRETLKMSNSEDMNHLTSYSLLFLGQIFYQLGAYQDSLTMANPGHQLAAKVQDPYTQLWATSLLEKVYIKLNDTNNAKINQELYESTKRVLQENINS